MSPNKILNAWLKRWERTLPEGKLSEEYKKRFLDRPEVNELQQYGEQAVLEAISKHQELKNILGEAQVLSYSAPPPKKPWIDGGGMIPRGR